MIPELLHHSPPNHLQPSQPLFTGCVLHVYLCIGRQRIPVLGQVLIDAPPGLEKMKYTKLEILFSSSGGLELSLWAKNLKY